VGVILFEMLTGRRPQRYRPGTAPGCVRPGVPVWLDAVVLKLLAEEPWDRYQDAAEVVAAIAEGEAGAQREAEENARREAEEKAGREAEAKSRRDAEEAARREAQQKARRTLLRSRLRIGLAVLCGLAAIALVLGFALRRCGGPAQEPPTPLGPVTRETDGVVMVHVPAGEFVMGSAASDPEAADNEKPQHTVYLDAFYIDRTEVTNAQYRAFVAATGRPAPTTCHDSRQPTYDDAGKRDHPVVCVSWEDATAYCAWAGARLPTEAEWEKAARGTEGRIYPWEDEFDDLWLNYRDANCESQRNDKNANDGYSRTAPVGSYLDGASPYGALDMAGNALEWVGDWYSAGYYGRSPSQDPRGPETGTTRVVRGGSWGDWPLVVRSAFRFWFDPSAFSELGFRCASAVSPQGP